MAMWVQRYLFSRKVLADVFQLTNGEGNYLRHLTLSAQLARSARRRECADDADIADSGIAQAYIAWKDSLSLQDKPLRLPGLSYTDEQLFFVSFARIWASIARPAAAVQQVRTDPHSPRYWRTTGTLRNLEAFHKAWGCKAGSGVSRRCLEEEEIRADGSDESAQEGSVCVVVSVGRRVAEKERRRDRPRVR
jgi:hypothetical protein